MSAEERSDNESIDSQLEWELEQGIPQIDDPFIQKYMNGRNALIEQEKKQRHDRLFKQTMSPLARQAARIMASVRKREIKTKWTPQHEETVSQQTQAPLYSGMMFALARERMETTELWKIVERMPKGALLHAHMDAMFDIDWMVEQSLNEPGYCILAEEPLTTAERRDSCEISFQFFPEQEIQKAKSSPSIWSDKYIPGTPVSAREAQRTFPDNDMTFKKWLVGRATISPEESLRHHKGVDAIWKVFLSTFRTIRAMLFYEPIFRKVMQRLLGQLAADHISYVDFRMAFVFQFYLTGKTTPQPGFSDFIRIFGEEIEKFKSTEAGKSFGGARMIWTIIRIFDNKTIAESMMECIKIKKQFPHLICGFDCVGQEDAGRPLADLTPLLFWFKKKCHEAGVDIPFFFHAGECLGDGDSTDSNLYDAILLGTRRIGHGYSLYKHPLLIDMVKEKKIMIESCPISNEILRLSSSILAHSLPALLSRGVSVSLNNDDPANLGTSRNGLTHDFWQAVMGWENLGLEGLATMAENSLKWCAVEDQKQSDWIKGINDSYMGKTKKATLLKQWRTEFEKWCQWIIMEYPLEIEEDNEVDEDDEDDDDDEE